MEIIKANSKGASYNRKLKIQGAAIIEHAFFDPTKHFSFENTSKYTLNCMKYMLLHYIQYLNGQK